MIKRIDTDRGYKKLVDRLKKIGKAEVTVGIHADEGGAGYPNGTTVLDVGIFNEFGTSRIPPRSFIRAWFDEAQEEGHRKLKELVAKVPQGESVDKALEKFGLWAVGQVQARIASNIPPPNAPSTVAKKGSSTTLIDTGQLRSSITYKVDR